MSNLAKTVKRRVHKERAQPSDRSHLGLLERHKDYKLRAKDYHRKADAIHKLRQKAANKNPDEFHTSMHSQETKVRVES
mgnify:CR=1 FL=1